MYRLDREVFLQSKYIGLWAALGFQAGYINSFGFLVAGFYVSHVTGFGTQIGLALGKHAWIVSWEVLLIPLFFILGAFLSGIITSARIERKLKPRYDLVMLSLPITLIAIMVFCQDKAFIDFHEKLFGPSDFIISYILAALCGVQNGCFATMTKGQIRTTHLTGISTDIGSDFAKLFFGKLSPVEREFVLRNNITRISTFIAFSFGAVLSALITDSFRHYSLLVPATTSIVGYFAVTKISRSIDRRGMELLQTGTQLIASKVAVIAATAANTIAQKSNGNNRLPDGPSL